MGIGQVLTMPIFFASNAIHPIDIMPGWLRVVSMANPLTYQVDALRALMIRDFSSVYGIGLDVAVLAGFTAVFTLIAARLYPRLTSMNAPAQRLAKMLLRASAAGLLWAAAAPVAASAESSWTLEPANSGREPIAQSCTTGDRDRCVDDVTRCFRDCDTLERCALIGHSFRMGEAFACAPASGAARLQAHGGSLAKRFMSAMALNVDPTGADDE
jgi:ABC-2 family transporter